MKRNPTARSISGKYSSLATSKSTNVLPKYNTASTESNLARNSSHISINKSGLNELSTSLISSKSGTNIAKKQLPLRGFKRRDSYVEKYNDTQEFLRKKGESELEWKKRIEKLREEIRLREEKERQEKLKNREHLRTERSLKSSQQSISFHQNNGANVSNVESDDGFFGSPDKAEKKEKLGHFKYSKANYDYYLNDNQKEGVVIMVDRQTTENSAKNESVVRQTMDEDEVELSHEINENDLRFSKASYQKSDREIFSDYKVADSQSYQTHEEQKNQLEGETLRFESERDEKIQTEDNAENDENAENIDDENDVDRLEAEKEESSLQCDKLNKEVISDDYNQHYQDGGYDNEIDNYHDNRKDYQDSYHEQDSHEVVSDDEKRKYETGLKYDNELEKESRIKHDQSEISQGSNHENSYDEIKASESLNNDKNGNGNYYHEVVSSRRTSRMHESSIDHQDKSIQGDFYNESGFKPHKSEIEAKSSLDLQSVSKPANCEEDSEDYQPKETEKYLKDSDKEEIKEHSMQEEAKQESEEGDEQRKDSYEIKVTGENDNNALESEQMPDTIKHMQLVYNSMAEVDEEYLNSRNISASKRSIKQHDEEEEECEDNYAEGERLEAEGDYEEEEENRECEVHITNQGNEDITYENEEDDDERESIQVVYDANYQNTNSNHYFNPTSSDQLQVRESISSSLSQQNKGNKNLFSSTASEFYDAESNVIKEKNFDENNDILLRTIRPKYGKNRHIQAEQKQQNALTSKEFNNLMKTVGKFTGDSSSQSATQGKYSEVQNLHNSNIHEKQSPILEDVNDESQANETIALEDTGNHIVGQSIKIKDEDSLVDFTNKRLSKFMSPIKGAQAENGFFNSIDYNVNESLNQVNEDEDANTKNDRKEVKEKQKFMCYASDSPMRAEDNNDLDDQNGKNRDNYTHLTSNKQDSNFSNKNNNSIILEMNEHEQDYQPDSLMENESKEGGPANIYHQRKLTRNNSHNNLTKKEDGENQSENGSKIEYDENHENSENNYRNDSISQKSKRSHASQENDYNAHRYSQEGSQVQEDSRRSKEYNDSIEESSPYFVNKDRYGGFNINESLERITEENIENIESFQIKDGNESFGTNFRNMSLAESNRSNRQGKSIFDDIKHLNKESLISPKFFSESDAHEESHPNSNNINVNSSNYSFSTKLQKKHEANDRNSATAELANNTDDLNKFRFSFNNATSFSFETINKANETSINIVRHLILKTFKLKRNTYVETIEAVGASPENSCFEDKDKQIDNTIDMSKVEKNHQKALKNFNGNLRYHNTSIANSKKISTEESISFNNKEMKPFNESTKSQPTLIKEQEHIYESDQEKEKAKTVPQKPTPTTASQKQNFEKEPSSNTKKVQELLSMLKTNSEKLLPRVESTDNMETSNKTLKNWDFVQKYQSSICDQNSIRHDNMMLEQVLQNIEKFSFSLDKFNTSIDKDKSLDFKIDSLVSASACNSKGSLKTFKDFESAKKEPTETEKEPKLDSKKTKINQQDLNADANVNSNINNATDYSSSCLNTVESKSKAQAKRFETEAFAIEKLELNINSKEKKQSVVKSEVAISITPELKPRKLAIEPASKLLCINESNFEVIKKENKVLTTSIAVGVGDSISFNRDELAASKQQQAVTVIKNYQKKEENIKEKVKENPKEKKALDSYVMKDEDLSQDDYNSSVDINPIVSEREAEFSQKTVPKAYRLIKDTKEIKETEREREVSGQSTWRHNDYKAEKLKEEIQKQFSNIESSVPTKPIAGVHLRHKSGDLSKLSAKIEKLNSNFNSERSNPTHERKESVGIANLKSERADTVRYNSEGPSNIGCFKNDDERDEVEERNSEGNDAEYAIEDNQQEDDFQQEGTGDEKLDYFTKQMLEFKKKREQEKLEQEKLESSKPRYHAKRNSLCEKDMNIDKLISELSEFTAKKAMSKKNLQTQKIDNPTQSDLLIQNISNKKKEKGLKTTKDIVAVKSNLVTKFGLGATQAKKNSQLNSIACKGRNEPPSLFSEDDLAGSSSIIQNEDHFLPIDDLILDNNATTKLKNKIQEKRAADTKTNTTKTNHFNLLSKYQSSKEHNALNKTLNNTIDATEQKNVDESSFWTNNNKGGNGFLDKRDKDKFYEKYIKKEITSKNKVNKENFFDGCDERKPLVTNFSGNLTQGPRHVKNKSSKVLDNVSFLNEGGKETSERSKLFSLGSNYGSNIPVKSSKNLDTLLSSNNFMDEFLSNQRQENLYTAASPILPISPTEAYTSAPGHNRHRRTYSVSNPSGNNDMSIYPSNDMVIIHKKDIEKNFNNYFFNKQSS